MKKHNSNIDKNSQDYILACIPLQKQLVQIGKSLCGMILFFVLSYAVMSYFQLETMHILLLCCLFLFLSMLALVRVLGNYYTSPKKIEVTSSGFLVHFKNSSYSIQYDSIKAINREFYSNKSVRWLDVYQIDTNQKTYRLCLAQIGGKEQLQHTLHTITEKLNKAKLEQMQSQAKKLNKAEGEVPGQSFIKWNQEKQTIRGQLFRCSIEDIKSIAISYQASAVRANCIYYLQNEKVKTCPFPINSKHREKALQEVYYFAAKNKIPLRVIAKGFRMI